MSRLGTFYNALPGEKENWRPVAEEKYPEAYAELQKCDLFRKFEWDPDIPEEFRHPALIHYEYFYGIGPLGRDVRP